jgi:hypothetical protein
MKRVLMTVAVGIALSGSVFAASKPCEELKAEIDAKIKAKGAVDYTLEVIPASEAKDQEIVGSCEGGSKKIAYVRVQQAAVTSKTNYELVSRACDDAVSDIKFILSNNDLVKGLIVARPVAEGEESYTKLSIQLAKADDGVTVTVRYFPTSGARIRGGVVDAYLKALKERLPDVVASPAN